MKNAKSDYHFKTKEDVNILCARWNNADEASDEEMDTFTAALNLVEDVMTERNAYREAAILMGHTAGGLDERAKEIVLQKRKARGLS